MNLYDDDYPTCLQTYAMLRLFSNDVGPDEVTALLGVVPTDAFAKGALFGESRTRRFNAWFLSSEGAFDSRDSRRHIDWIISKIMGRSRELAGLQARGVDIDVSCYWVSAGQGGPVLSPRQMKDLVELNLNVAWDIYFGESNEYESKWSGSN